jgi:hypothetical protein
MRRMILPTECEQIWRFLSADTETDPAEYLLFPAVLSVLGHDTDHPILRASPSAPARADMALRVDRELPPDGLPLRPGVGSQR